MVAEAMEGEATVEAMVAEAMVVTAVAVTAVAATEEAHMAVQMEEEMGGGGDRDSGRFRAKFRPPCPYLGDRRATGKMVTSGGWSKGSLAFFLYLST